MSNKNRESPGRAAQKSIVNFEGQEVLTTIQSDIIYVRMPEYSTRQTAEKLGLSLITLQRYIAKKKIPVPALRRVGAGKFRIWTSPDIEKVRKILPSLKNGRKTRYQKQKTKPQARAPVQQAKKKK